MSSNSVTPPAPVVKLTAIQIIENEIVEFFKQREQAIANLHAVNGAIQGAQQLLAKLKAEAVKAEAEAQKILTEVEAGAKKVLTEAENSVKSAARAVESKVVSIVDAVKKDI